MIIRRGYKFQLKTNTAQMESLSRVAGCVRLVWNRILNDQQTLIDQQEKVLTYAQSTAKLVALKKELPFLAEVHSQPLQQTLKDQSRALIDAFRRVKGFPRFKKKGHHDSFKFPQGVKLESDKIYLPKLGWFRFHKSHDVLGTIKNVVVSRKIDKWYVAIQVEIEVLEPAHPSTSVIGIDMGVKNFATLSNGTVVAPINSFRKTEKRLAKEQRKLSRKTKFSSNWKKQKIKISRVYQKIARVRHDFLHKVTTAISKNHAVIVLEDLRVRNMSGSASGTIEEPGRNVAAKRGLNKSILDQGWYEFRRQLQYKQEWRGGKLIVVPATNTSRMCRICGHTDGANRINQQTFSCQQCGHTENADINAAKNILAAGRAVLACGDIEPVTA